MLEEFLQHTLLTLGNNQPSLIISLREKALASMRDKRRGISSHLICCATLGKCLALSGRLRPFIFTEYGVGLDQCFSTFPAIVSHAILCVFSRRRVLVSVAYVQKGRCYTEYAFSDLRAPPTRNSNRPRPLRTSPESSPTVTGSPSGSNFLKTKMGFRHKLREFACSQASNNLFHKDKSVYLIKDPRRAYAEPRACTESPLMSENDAFPGE